MSTLTVTSEDQIQRLNLILSKVQQLQELSFQTLIEPPSAKSWSIMEVVQHLNISYGIYRPKFDDYLNQTPRTEEDTTGFKVRAWQKMLINMQRPRGDVRKWRMKTLKRFEPLLDIQTLDDKTVKDIFATFFESHLHFKKCILDSRGKDARQRKITSAIGPAVKFYLPEAFEFLLSHLERHMVQIKEILDKD